MTSLRLTGRSSSHFTRVVRMFAHELAIPLELEVIHDLRSLDPAIYGGHPAMKLPTLHVDSTALFGTDNICRKLTELAGRTNDPRVILSPTSDLARNAQELVWHAMTVQVQLVLGVMLAKLPADNPYIVKTTLGMQGALAWLDVHLDDTLAALLPRDVSLLELTLFALLEHITFRPSISLAPFPALTSFATVFSARDSARVTPYHFDKRTP